MLETIVKTAYGIIFGITNFYIMNKLLDTKEKLISRKNIIQKIINKKTKNEKKNKYKNKKYIKKKK